MAQSESSDHSRFLSPEEIDARVDRLVQSYLSFAALFMIAPGRTLKLALETHDQNLDRLVATKPPAYIRTRAKLRILDGNSPPHETFPSRADGFS